MKKAVLTLCAMPVLSCALITPVFAYPDIDPSHIKYTVTDFSFTGIGGGKVNEQGQVYNATQLWDPVTGVETFENLKVIDMNAKGDALAQSTLDNHYFIWNRTSNTQKAISGIPSDSQFTKLNNRNQVLGKSVSEDTYFIWDKAKGVKKVDLSVTESTNWWLDSNVDFNDKGEVVGLSKLGRNDAEPVYWSETTGRKILSTDPYNGWSAHYINNDSQIAGAMTWGMDTALAVWNNADAHVAYSDLIWGPTSHVRIRGLNDSMQVTGFVESDSVLHHPGSNIAFVWDPENGVQSLHSLIYTEEPVILTGATSINNAGQIVAYGMVYEGCSIYTTPCTDFVSYLLTPTSFTPPNNGSGPVSAVPEPPMFLLMLTGLGVFLMIAVHRRKRN